MTSSSNGLTLKTEEEFSPDKPLSLTPGLQPGFNNTGTSVSNGINGRDPAHWHMPILKRRLTLPPGEIPIPASRKETKTEIKISTIKPLSPTQTVMISMKEGKLGTILENDKIKKVLFDRIRASRDDVKRQIKELDASVEVQFPIDFQTVITKKPQPILSELVFKTMYGVPTKYHGAEAENKTVRQIEEAQHEYDTTMQDAKNLLQSGINKKAQAAGLVNDKLADISTITFDFLADIDRPRIKKDALELQRDYIVKIISEAATRDYPPAYFTEAHELYEQELQTWRNRFVLDRVATILSDHELRVKFLEDGIVALENTRELKKLVEKKQGLNPVTQKHEFDQLEAQIAELKRDAEWNQHEIDSLKKEIQQMERDKEARIDNLKQTIDACVAELGALWIFNAKQAIEELPKWNTERSKLKAILLKYTKDRDIYTVSVAEQQNQLKQTADYYRQLLDCCKKSSWTQKDYDKLTAYLTNPEEINHADAFGNTPLHYAVMLYDLDLIKKIKELKKTHHSKKERFVAALFTPFQLALQKQHSDTLKVLEEIKPEKTDDLLDFKCIEIAVRFNNLKALKWLIDRHIQLGGYEKDAEKTRALNKLLFNDLFSVACKNGFMDIVDHLFQLMKKDPSVLQTSLEDAYLQGRTDVVKFFTENGFIPDKQSNEFLKKQATFEKLEIPVFIQVPREPSTPRMAPEYNQNDETDGKEMQPMKADPTAINGQVPQPEPVVEDVKADKAQTELARRNCDASAKNLAAVIKIQENALKCDEVILKEIEARMAKKREQLAALKEIQARSKSDSREKVESALLRYTVTRFTPTSPVTPGTPVKTMSPPALQRK